MRASLVAAGLALTALAVIAPHAHAAPGKDPFAGVPTPATVATKFVGLVNSVPLGIHVGSGDDAIGYWCDGTGKVSVWFKGNRTAGSSAITMTAVTGGSTISFDTLKRTGKIKQSGVETSFSLEAAKGIAGIYRQSGASAKGAVVGGWVVTDAGYTAGQVSQSGVVLEAGVENLSKTIGTQPVTVSPVTTTPGVPPDAQVMSLRCGLLSFRIGFNKSQAGDETGAAAQDASEDVARLNQRFRDQCRAS